MKKTAYIKPLVEVTQIETEQFIAISATETNIEGLGIDNEPTDEEGRSRLLFLFDE
ncbi:MAG: hypothetical protein IKM76_06110 [Prevotella sp.]|nr:hypothetical protein [Prevotella sp.]